MFGQQKVPTERIWPGDRLCRATALAGRQLWLGDEAVNCYFSQS
jgi:hypothetical protein